MTILIGEQGAQKSTALATIGGAWYAIQHEPATSKDFFLVFRGKILVEVAEMAALSKADKERIKSVLSTATDSYRAPYATYTEDHPRQSIIAGTSNAHDQHDDETGARRYWPIRVGRIQIAALEADREQLFAEAAACYQRGEDWWSMPKEQELIAQEARRTVHSWEAILAQWLHVKNEVCLSEVLTEGLKVEVGRQTRAINLEAGKVLRALGWEKRRIWRDGHTSIRWCRPGTEDESLADDAPY